ncbi:MAG: AIPR family protein [Treponema sp.]|jgi:hypothetical protein|nr:AIPR family protein [Treponema sp.]
MEPIIKSKFDRFCDKMDIKDLQEGIAFERFVNYSILVGHQPDAFNGDNELFEKINTGGSQDMGIDGIAIKVNGSIIRSLDEIQDLIKKMRNIDIEYIFIQAKNKTNFDKGEFLKFTFGVKEFLAEKQNQPVSEKIQEFIQIKEYLNSDDVLSKLNSYPTLRLYYVVMGKWCDDPQLLSVAESFKEDINAQNAYKDIKTYFVDNRQFGLILNSIENNFEETINTIQIMHLPETEMVDDSCVLLCYASELNKILTSPDGLIRKSLFEDNVRDYQGDNNINNEINKTIEKEPQKFALLNNGITIVCEKFNIRNNKVLIKNPQIVNGCQTSHVIFNNSNNADNLSNAPIIVKLISTKNDEITNQIVRSTNRQNIVYEEAFEATKPFHKELEEYINAVSPQYEQFYYERRSKQYSHNTSIKNYQKINLRIVTQSFVGMFQCEPHHSHRHETKLIEMYRNIIFQEQQAKEPYFTATLAFYKLEKYFRINKIDRKYYAFRHHIMMIFSELIGGGVPNINDEKNIKAHCMKMLNSLKDDDLTYRKYKEAIQIFEDVRKEWINKLGRDKFGIKDVKEFTELLLKKVRKDKNIKIISTTDNDYVYYGEIIFISKDKTGQFYGFISRKPYRIFFHQKDARNLDLSNNSVIGNSVMYKIGKNRRGDEDIAIDVKKI